MGIFDITPGSVSPVEILHQFSGPATEAIRAGAAVFRHPTTGWVAPCGSADIPTGVAITTTTYAGQAMTAVRKGVVDLGGSALTPYAFGATVYVHGNAGGSATGTLGTAPTGGGTFPIGTITGISQSHSGNIGGTLGTDKLLYVDL